MTDGQCGFNFSWFYYMRIIIWVVRKAQGRKKNDF